MIGTIRYRTREKIDRKPEIFTTGGYTGVDKDGKEIIFDWCDMYAFVEELDDGRMEIEVTLKNFDIEFLRDSNEITSISARELSKLNLNEIFYECYLDKEEEGFVELDIIEFIIYDCETNKEYGFAGLEEYNRGN